MTLRLSDEEQAALRRHGIGESEVFDATDVFGSPVAAMKACGAVVVVGWRSCRDGHRIHTRAGKCIMCNPAAITFQRRNAQTQYVYVAHSLAHGLSKIGVATDVYTRIEEINRKAHAGACDWLLIEQVRVERAGEIEELALRTLRAWKGVKRGQDAPGCYEVVRCD